MPALLRPSLSAALRPVGSSPRCVLRPVVAPLQRARCVLVRAANDGFESHYKPEEFGLAPAMPKTAFGEQLSYYLTMEPQLFKAALEGQLQRLKMEKEEKEKQKLQLAESSQASTTSSTDLVLSQRMEELREREKSHAIEDIMYVSILERFLSLSVDMLPHMDGYVDVQPTSLTALTEGIHSKEALELVREHLMGVMGPTTANQFSNVAIKMSKYQMAQVYAASIMFGYFLRRVDRRFQLERAVGAVPSLSTAASTSSASFTSAAASASSPASSPAAQATEPVSEEETARRLEEAIKNQEEAVRKLEKVFAMADADHPDDAETLPKPSSSSSSSASASSSASSNLPVKKEKSALRRYVESFDQATMVETARIMSQEGAALVERQTSAILGDIKTLTKQIQDAVGKDVTSMEQVMERMASAVEADRIATVTMSVGTQRRAVLEAVAFGTFLREVEDWVHTEFNLLTPLPPPRMGSRGSLDEDD